MVGFEFISFMNWPTKLLLVNFEQFVDAVVKDDLSADSARKVSTKYTPAKK